MAFTSTIQVNITEVGTGLNNSHTPTSEVNTNAPCVYQPGTVLATGNNTLVAPTSAKNLIIENASAALFLKGVSGDTGWNVPTGGLVKLPVTGGASYIINTSAGATVDIRWD